MIASPTHWLLSRRGCSMSRRGSSRAPQARRHRSWVLLETVIATGLLILGLAVIGAQVQGADTSIRQMELRFRAMLLAEWKLAELDLGLVELDSVDEIQEEEFGSRYPDFGWRLVTDETGLGEMYLLTFEVLYLPQASEDYGDYQEGDFDFDIAETVFTSYALRTTPRPLDLSMEFGLDEDEFLEISEKLGEFGIPGLDAEALDLTFFAKSDMEEVLKALPLLADVFGVDLSQFMALLPADLVQELKESGLLELDGGGKDLDGARDGSGGEEAGS